MLTNCARPLADVVIDNEIERWSRWMCYPEGQIHALRAAARLIAVMPPSHVGRQVSRLASRLELDHAFVTEAVTDALTEVTAAARGRSPGMRCYSTPTRGNSPESH